MDLEEFVSASLLQIVRGVASSAAAISELGGAVSPAFSAGPADGKLLGTSRDGSSAPVYGVTFDVALTVGNSTGAEGGAKLQVATIFSAGGRVGSTDKQESTSRLQFMIPLQLPTDPQTKAASDKIRAENSAKVRQRRVVSSPYL